MVPKVGVHVKARQFKHDALLIISLLVVCVAGTLSFIWVLFKNKWQFAWITVCKINRSSFSNIRCVFVSGQWDARDLKLNEQMWMHGLIHAKNLWLKIEEETTSLQIIPAWVQWSAVHSQQWLDVRWHFFFFFWCPSLFSPPKVLFKIN